MNDRDDGLGLARALIICIPIAAALWIGAGVVIYLLAA